MVVGNVAHNHYFIILNGGLIIMKIKEIRERNKTEFKLFLWYAPFNDNGTECRRVMLLKDGLPHIVSEDYEILQNGEWVLPSP